MPIFLGAAINKFLTRLGAKASDGELLKHWGDLFGDEFTLIKLSRGAKDRTIYIRAKNPAERLALSYRAADIIEKINSYFGYDAVSKVVVR
jgi:hypothetical protein